MRSPCWESTATFGILIESNDDEPGPHARGSLRMGEFSINVVIVSGGRGERLLPLTAEVPKPLLTVANRPLLDWTLRTVHHLGWAVSTVLSTGYLHERVAEHLRQRPVSDAPDLVRDQLLAGAWPAVLPIWRDRWPDQPVLVWMGDTFARPQLKDLLASHRASGALLTAAVHRASYGGVRRGRFVPRPTPGGGRLSYEETACAPGDLVNLGIYYLEAEAREWFGGLRDLDDTARFMHRALAANAVNLFEVPSYSRNINTAADLLDTNMAVLDELRLAHVDHSTQLAPRARLLPPFRIGPDGQVADAVVAGPRVVVGHDCRIGPDAQVRASLLLAHAQVPAGAQVHRSVVGPGGAVTVT